jgi:hypothetical protein
MADGPIDDASSATPAANSDEFDGLVFDDEFVRGGTYEPPARTRVAIARYGDQQTSWRHGGGMRRAQPSRAPEAGSGRRPRQRASSRPTRPTNSALPSPAMARLPLIITVVVVAIAAFLVFH